MSGPSTALALANSSVARELYADMKHCLARVHVTIGAHCRARMIKLGAKIEGLKAQIEAVHGELAAAEQEFDDLLSVRYGARNARRAASCR